jgi:ubiquinone/menaquinone biosynthesis C-methylase UbiE
VEKACSAQDLDKARQRTTAGLHGEVVEIGFGTGLNLPHLPGAVTMLHAVEPQDKGQRIGADRIAESAVPVRFVGLDAQTIPLADASMDSALCTFTLCTIPDAELALRELIRVLKPGGTLNFLEHGLSPDAGVAAWQRRLSPIQRRLCGGCTFDRPVANMVTGAGLELVELDNWYRPGPKTPSYLYRGVARKSA